MAALELVHLAGSSFVVPGPTNIGVIESGTEAILVDSGNDKDMGRKLLRLCEDKGLKLKAIVNTHSNADHIGGNQYLQKNTGCRILSSKGEKPFIESPAIEASFLWGGFPVGELDNKFFRAEASTVTDLFGEPGCPDIGGSKIVALPGHFFDMIGVLTKDGVFYMADCLFGRRVLEKHGIPFIYDVSAYKETIRMVQGVEAEFFVMSHGEVQRDIVPLALENLDIVRRVEDSILDIVKMERGFEGILKEVCDRFGIGLDCGRYALVGSTIRSFLTCLRNENRIGFRFHDNAMLWSDSMG